nr:MAG TPA: hypothetical protein [Caudoviricetes sp.]
MLLLFLYPYLLLFLMFLTNYERIIFLFASIFLFNFVQLK